MGNEFMENLWGWQVTNPDIVQPWVWDEVKRVYIDDGHDLDLDGFLADGSNVHVRLNMLAILLTAADKGFYEPSEKELARPTSSLSGFEHGLGAAMPRPPHHGLVRDSSMPSRPRNSKQCSTAPPRGPCNVSGPHHHLGGRSHEDAPFRLDRLGPRAGRAGLGRNRRGLGSAPHMTPASLARIVVDALAVPVQAALLCIAVGVVVDVGVALGERWLRLPRAQPGDEARLERVARTRIERADVFARIGPMLGLMGTLIPLGPGLAALGRGDVVVLAQAVTVAFDTTVLGLLVGVLGLVLGRLRRRWTTALSRLEGLQTRPQERPWLNALQTASIATPAQTPWL